MGCVQKDGPGQNPGWASLRGPGAVELMELFQLLCKQEGWSCLGGLDMAWAPC
jgi:hypothetical protein